MASSRQFLQPGSGRSLTVERPSQLEHREPESPALPPVLPEIHAKSYLSDGTDWTFRCTCGYVSLWYCTEAQAIETPCEVEVLLAESQERLRRLYRRAV